MNFVPLASVADIQLGKMLSPKAKTGKANFPYLRNQNVQWDRINISDLAEMDFSEEEQKKFSLQAGDLLICEGGEPGRCAVWNGELENCYYQKALHRVRPHPGCADPTFLAYWIRLQALTGTFEDQNAKTTIAHLPLIRLEQLPIPVLSFDSQIEIVRRLRAQFENFERARDACIKQSEEITHLANAIIRESVDRHPVRREQLGDLLDEVKQGVGSAWKDYPLLGATREGIAPAKELIGKNPERYKPVSQGTVFYNPMRILIGSIAMVDDVDTAGITSPDYVVLRGRDGVVDSRWFYYWLRSPEGERCITSLARGAVRERMLFSRLAEGEIALPPYEVQRAASQALAQIRPMKQQVEAQLRDIDLLPGRLLAQTFEES
jgi:type I restriction enzyme S subunit